MLILGIESASLTAGAALLKDDVIIAEYNICYQKTHSQTLLPMIDEILAMTQTDKKDLTAIAVSAGPGSYTGLRIGSATAKGLALALKIPIVPVSTLAAMAYQCWGSRYRISPVMDARRGQVYTALYEFNAFGDFVTIAEPQVVMMEEWLKNPAVSGQPVLFTGDAAALYRDRIREMNADSVTAPSFANAQRAAAVAQLGAVLFRENRTETSEQHLPVYLKKSQAEREREISGQKIFEI